jgi:hypothetical protein
MTADAEAIANKLARDTPSLPGRERFRVDVKNGRRHSIVKVWYRSQHIGQYGIQRSSESKRHNYVAEQLHLSRIDAYNLAKCPLDVDAYITILENKGEILVMP